MPLFVAIEPASLSAGGSGPGSTGLGTWSGTKKKAIYSHDPSYKKPKKPEVTDEVVDLSAGPLPAALLHLDDEEHKVSWGSEVKNNKSSMSGMSNVENIVNTIAEKTSYTESSEDNEMNKTMPRKTRTRIYVLGKSPKAPTFDSISNNENALSLLFPKMINGSNPMLFVKSRIIENLIKAREIAVHEKIVVNSDLKKANIHSNWEVVVKKISVDLPKLAVELVFSKFGKIVSIRMHLIGLWQKALIEFESLEVASLVTSKWSVLVGKDSVCVVLAVNDKQTWMSRDCHRALLYTFPVGTSAHDLSELLVSYDEKTCFIGRNPDSYVCDWCVIICFKNEDARLAAVSTISIFKSVRLHWTSFVLASCIKCEQFGHTTTNCPVNRSSGVHGKRVVSDQDWVHLAGIYKKKSASITHPVLFGGKTWAQVAGGISFHVPFFGSSDSGLCSGLVPPSAVSDFFVVSYLSDCLAILECSLELLADRVSGILVRLDSFGVVLLVPFFLVSSPIAFAVLSSKVNSDMIIDNALSFLNITPPVTNDAVVNFSASDSKILTAKVGSLETKLVTLEALVGLVLDKLNLLCSGSDLSAPTLSQ
ncbi:hypothetical protein G9A89_004565 [Geosiphon pyriformis]|nr:hypothetical protein G9A89_004565 [Geosiphon pyriformis]